MLRLTFLGTGTSQGVPMIGCNCPVCRSADPRDHRLRSSVMIERIVRNDPEAFSVPAAPSYGMYTRCVGAQARIVIDAGPDFRYQMLRENVRTLDAILLTHEHKDHMAGIDDVRAFNYFQGHAIPIYATERVGAAVRKDFDYAFAADRYPGAPEIDLRTIAPEEQLLIAGLRITPISGRHYILPVTGFRIGPLAYLTDFNSIDDRELDKLRGIDTLVINALRREKHLSHFTVDEAVAVSRRIGPRRTLLTHLSHQIGLHSEAGESLPQNVEMAYDGLRVEVPEPSDAQA